MLVVRALFIFRLFSAIFDRERHQILGGVVEEKKDYCLFPCCDGNSRCFGNFGICISTLQEKPLPKCFTCDWPDRIRCVFIGYLYSVFSGFHGVRPSTGLKLRSCSFQRAFDTITSQTQQRRGIGNPISLPFVVRIMRG